MTNGDDNICKIFGGYAIEDEKSADSGQCGLIIESSGESLQSFLKKDYPKWDNYKNEKLWQPEPWIKSLSNLAIGLNTRNNFNDMNT